VSAFDLTEHERGVVRVFALSLSEAEAKALRETGLKRLFGGAAVDVDGLEIFPVSDLEDVGLWGLLADGHGIAQDQLEPDRAKLAALDGWVIVATSGAFPARPATVTLAPEITLIGTYSEPKVIGRIRSRSKVLLRRRRRPLRKDRLTQLCLDGSRPWRFWCFLL